MADGREKCPTSSSMGPKAAVAANAPLFDVLSGLLQQVESLTNQEEVELRSKIQALGLEVAKVPSKLTQNLDETEIAKQMDKLSEKLDEVDRKISSAVAADPQVGSLLSSTADLWMPIITARSEERRNLIVSVEDNHKVEGKDSQ